MRQRLTPIFNRPCSLTDDEWAMLVRSRYVRERFGLTNDPEALIRGAHSTFAARFDIDDYHAVYILHDNLLQEPPLILTRDGSDRLCPHPCPDHEEPHVPVHA